MSKNCPEIPYTELVERAQKLARVGNNTTEKIRGVVQDVYCREIPAKFDWTFLLASSSLTTTQEYHTGTISMNTGATTVVFSSDVSVDASFVGRKFKPSGNDTIYEITVYQNATALTISPALQGASNLTSASYSIYQPLYSLAHNFDRFPKPGGIYRWVGGRKQLLEDIQYASYINNAFAPTASVPNNTRLIGTDTAGNTVVEFIPPPKDSKVYGCDYYKQLMPLYELTGGTISSIAAKGTTVNGTGTNFTEALTDGTFFFRIDNFGTGQDSSWYRILAVTNDSQMTLSTVFANSAVSGIANYTIARAPDMPVRLHIGILYGTLRALTVDQNDPNAQFYHAQYAQVMSDAKKILVSRPYSQDVTGVFEDYRYRR
jgi:hypothetical protein